MRIEGRGTNPNKIKITTNDGKNLMEDFPIYSIDISIQPKEEITAIMRFEYGHFDIEANAVYKMRIGDEMVDIIGIVLKDGTIRYLPETDKQAFIR